MATEYPDQYAGRMNAADRRHYEQIRESLAEHRAAAGLLEDELARLVSSYGLPLGTSDAPQTQVVQELRVNNWWVKTPPEWCCPCCKRNKQEIVRADRSGRAFGSLIAHHDHFRELLDNIVAERARALGVVDTTFDEASNRFVRRFTDGLIRFDELIICEDCNNADARGKSVVNAPAHLTFTVSEIASFIRVRPSLPHEIDRALVRSAYASALPKYEKRLQSAERLADIVLRNEHWLEHTDRELQPDWVDRNVESVMRLLGFDANARWQVAEELLCRTPVSRRNHAAWRTRARIASKPPSSAEVDYVAKSQAERWTFVADDWQCPGCGRSKMQIIRPTNQFNWMFVLESMRFLCDSSENGSAVVTICDACRQSVRDFNMEARNDPQIGAWPIPYLGLGDLRRIVRPQPHGLHNINGAQVEILITKLRDASTSD